MERCSRLVSTTDEGLVCQQWAKAYPGDADAVKVHYCNTYNTEDGACLNRKSYDEYNKVQSKNPLEDPCWWKPCQMTNTNLITTKEMNVQCPTTLCQQILSNFKSKDISVSDSSFYQVCEQNTNSKSNDSAGANGDSKLPGRGKGKNFYIILGAIIGGIVLAIAIILGVLFAFKKKKTSASGTPLMNNGGATTSAQVLGRIMPPDSEITVTTTNNTSTFNSSLT